MSRPTETSHTRKIQQFRSQMRQVLFQKRVVAWSTFWLFVWGTAILILRLTMGIHAMTSLWGALGFLPLWLLAWVQAARELPTEAAVRAFLDQQNELGGLLMASEETEVGRWQETIQTPTLPQLRWNNEKAGWMALTSLCFLAATFFVPQQYIKAQTQQPLDIKEPVQRLKKQIDVLKQEKVITAKMAKQWKKKLNQIQKKSKATDPAKTWQALDHLRKKAKEAAKKSAERKAAASEQIRKAAQWSKYLRQQAALKKSLRNKAGLSKAMKQMQKRLQQASRLQSSMALNKALQKKIAKLMKAMKSGKLTPKQMRALQKMLQKAQAQLSKSMSKLSKARLINPKSLSMRSIKFNKKMTTAACKGGKKGGKGGKKGGKGMMAMGSKGKQGMMTGMMPGGMPGKGAITRGPGHAPITWQKGKELKGVRFQPKALPMSRFLDLQRSKLLGVSLGAPGKGRTPVNTKQGGIQGVRIHHNSAHRFRILPQYRGTVQRYFQRKP